jgi:hypothetical protein
MGIGLEMQRSVADPSHRQRPGACAELTGFGTGTAGAYTIVPGTEYHRLMLPHRMRRRSKSVRPNCEGKWLLEVSGGLVVVYPAVCLASLADGVVLDGIEEKLPEERESRFWAMGTGDRVEI